MTDSLAPEGWLTGQLKDFMPLQRGFDLPTAEVVPGSVPVVYSNGIGRFHNLWMVKGPGVVTGRSGTIGTVHFVERDYWPHNTALWVTRFDTCEPRYTYQYLQYLGLDRFASGSGVPTLNRNDAHSFAVSIPRDRSERNAIARALTEADDFVASLERLIAKKQAIKQGMMQQLLTGRTRLPGFSEPWKSTTLAEVGETVRGVGYDPRVDLFVEASANTLDLLRSNNVQGGLLELSDVQHVDRRRVRADQVLRSGDILICAANGSKQLVGKAAFYQEVGTDRHTFGAFMAIFRTNPQEADPYFISLLMQTKKYREWIEVLLAGSSINNLRPSDIAAFASEFPDRNEQAAIAQVFEDVDAEIKALNQCLIAVRNIKRGMMQELLTGRTRLLSEEVAA